MVDGKAPAAERRPGPRSIGDTRRDAGVHASHAGDRIKMEHRRTRHTRRSRSDRRSSRSRSDLENLPFRTKGASPVHFRSRDRSCTGHQSMTEAQNAGSSQGATLPVGIWLRMYLRLFAVQGSWNYESLLGNGIAFCMEPALRL